ncbi:hypothetical protein ASF71_19165 [Deinococcus sp. Leaf326]|nr:hypothetical protein ASF71_19165 [Deinococcus sp. Leaf326]
MKRARRRKHEAARAVDYHRAYLPEVPYDLLSGMAIGKEAPETPEEHRQVSQRIQREAETRLSSQSFRQAQAEREMTPEA